MISELQTDLQYLVTRMKYYGEGITLERLEEIAAAVSLIDENYMEVAVVDQEYIRLDEHNEQLETLREELRNPPKKPLRETVVIYDGGAA